MVLLAEPLDTRELFLDAVRAGVLFAPGYQFLHDGRTSRGMRLSIALATPAEIRRGIALLGALARERLREQDHRSGRVDV